jgi:hypothetical protein
MKKSKLSYAEEAKRIIKKYEKRLGPNLDRPDKMATEAMNAELASLMERQELTKQAQQENKYKTMMAKGGNLPRYDGLTGISAYLPSGMRPYDFNAGIPTEAELTLNGNYRAIPFQAPITNVPNLYGAPTMPTKFGDLPGNNTIQPMQSISGVATPSRPTQLNYISGNYKDDKSNSGFMSDVPTEAWIGMGAQALGALGSAFLTKKPGKIKAKQTAVPDYVPVNNDEAVRQAELAYADAAASARYMSPSQYAAMRSNLAAGRARATAGIAEQTENANAQGRNAYNMQKAGLNADYNRQDLMAQEANVRNRMMYDQSIANIPGQLGQIVAGGTRDSMAYKMQEQTLPFLSQNNFGTTRDSKGMLVQTVNAGNGLSYYDDSKLRERIFMHNGKRINSTVYDKLLKINLNSKT